MIQTLGYALAGVVCVSALSFVGVFTLALKEKLLKSMVAVLVGVAAGALFGDAFLHLIPEAFETGVSQIVAASIIGGILLFFALEKFLAWRHSHGVHEETLESTATHDHSVKPLGPVVLFADAIHNFVDGTVIAASFLVSTQVGLATTLAVILHEIPQEMGDFGLLLHSGYARSKALLYNFISALTSVVGVFCVFLLGNMISTILPYLLAVTAGGFIYIAGVDLMPEIKKNKEAAKSLLDILYLLLGVALMLGLFYFE